MNIQNHTRHVSLAHAATRADNPIKRMVGLLNRSVLNPGEALIIVPCQSVHMLFMKFAIDVVFIDRSNTVVGLSANLPPFAFSAVFWKSACAIELPAGTIKQTGTQVGDKIAIQ